MAMAMAMADLALVLLCGAIIVYAVAIPIRRLCLSPLAAFPGPKLAALSNWYEFYYDVVLQGKFTGKIQQLHRQYGPIIRITPTELHIDDPDYYDTLYNSRGRRDKYAYFAGRFGYASDTFSTVEHDLHRQRRKALSPMFSGQKIDAFQPVIRGKVEKLCRKIAQYRHGQVLPLSRAWVALTTDIITEYAFARSYDQLDSPGFEETLHEALVAIYTVGHVALHFSFVFPMLDLLPEWLVRRAQPEILPVVGMRKRPPPEETSDARLGDEAQLIIAAGLITTSWALTVSSFHISQNPAILHTLRAELAGAGSTSTQPLDWHELQQLPYLHGCVHEGIRLAHGIVTRDPRRAPDVALHYAGWTIPPNTPVSMTNVDILTNETIFPRPADFCPERWIGRPELERYFVPFGRGSRACAGINLALAELYITLAVVFTRFTFDLYATDVSDVQMAHAFLVPYPKWDSKGVRVVVTER
ncbi:hypothetical protein QTJ16_001915 [Diplocarpon rosae]|uniref:Cytochrome P450 n=1 Tax=Diplocarpon rosae TaxID=946125 RepID=A0AAD9T4E4_9HELO|nr:hypothetical protein QTJ16_001915 [Diplocarpon rosae]